MRSQPVIDLGQIALSWGVALPRVAPSGNPRPRAGLLGARPCQPRDCGRGRRVTAAQGQEQRSARPNGLETVNASCAEQEKSRIRRWNPARIGHQVGGSYALPQVTGLALIWPKIVKVFEFMPSERCPRQDSNLRSRLRRGWHYLALTSGNVPAGDPVGHVLGTEQRTAGHGHAGRPMACHKPEEWPPREPDPAPGLPHRPWRARRAMGHAHTGDRGPAGSWTAAPTAVRAAPKAGWCASWPPCGGCFVRPRAGVSVSRT